MQQDAILWKAILEDIFDDFLRFFIEDADDIFDLRKEFEYLDKELEQLFPPEQNQYKPRYVDKLVKVFTQTGSEEWILVHIEVQGQADKAFAERMFQYYYRILDKYNRPITAFAIFTDGHPNYQPAQYQRSFLGTSVHFQYNTYKVLTQPKETLLASSNPFAAVVLTVQTALMKNKVSEQELLQQKLSLAKKLLAQNIPKPKIKALMNFLKYYVRFENPAINSNFEEQITQFTQNITTMGIEEFLLNRAKKEGIETGIEQGIETGKSLKDDLFVRNLLTQTDFTIEKIASLANVTVEFVKNVKESL